MVSVGFSHPPLSFPKPQNLHRQDRCCNVPFVFRGVAAAPAEMDVFRVWDKLLCLGWKREMAELRTGMGAAVTGSLLALSDGKCHQSN